MIILFIGLRFVLSSKSNTNKEPLSSNYEYHQKVQEFVSKEKGTDPNKEITTNEGGYTGVLIKNKQALLKATDTDGMISINDKITQSLEYISKSYGECKNLKGNELSGYYSENKGNISTILGISDLESFSKFISKLSFIDQGKISEANIDDSAQKGFSNEEVKFTLKLKADNAKEQEFSITSTIQDNNPKNIKLYWT
jgi:hypothetical protein